MSNRLLDSEMDSTISPLVDVIFNAMGAMFILLIVYIALVQPNDPRGLEIVTETIRAAVAYAPYDGGIAATGGATPYTYSIKRGDLPEGLVLEERTGRLYGNPRLRDDATLRDERFEFEVVVRDGSNQSVSRNFSLEVVPVGLPYSPAQQPLRFGPSRTATSEATTGKPWEFHFGVFGGIEEYEMLEFDHPPWMQSDLKSGRLFGTPPKDGTYTARLVIGDQQDSMKALRRVGTPVPVAELQVEVGVHDPPPPLDCEIVLPAGRVGRPYRGGVACLGGARSIRRFEVVGASPLKGLRLDPAKGILEGAPAIEGRSEIEVAVRDEGGATVNVSAELIILAAEPNFEISETKLPPGRVGDAYAAAVAVRGGTPPLRWERTDGGAALLGGLVFEGGRVRGTPSAVGRDVIGVRVVDAEGRTAEAVLAVEVAPGRRAPSFVTAPGEP